MRIAFYSLIFVFLNILMPQVSLGSIEELKERERKVKISERKRRKKGRKRGRKDRREKEK